MHKLPKIFLGPFEIACAAAILFLFFFPWITVLGADVRAHEIREKLEGALRIFNLVEAKGSYSLAYSLSGIIMALPVVTAVALLGNLFGKASAFMNALAGGLAVAIIAYLYFFVRNKPFHSLEWGAEWTLVAGAGLFAAGVLRGATSRPGR